MSTPNLMRPLRRGLGNVKPPAEKIKLPLEPVIPRSDPPAPSSAKSAAQARRNNARRLRYAEDPEYRAKQLQRGREYRARRKGA